MTAKECVKLCPDFKVSEKALSDGNHQVGAEWTNAKGVVCAAAIQMKSDRTPRQEAFFTEQLFIACHRMMTEDDA